jgi:hypothetical protein
MESKALELMDLSTSPIHLPFLRQSGQRLHQLDLHLLLLLLLLHASKTYSTLKVQADTVGMTDYLALFNDSYIVNYILYSKARSD